MAEYIDKQDATTIPVLPKEHRKYQTMNLDDAYENGWYDALECIEKLPPANVMPVIHCRDCAIPHNKWTGCPKLNGTLMYPEDFCSHSVNKEES